MLGHIVKTSTGYAIRYEARGSAEEAATDGSLFQFGADVIRAGEQIFLTEPNGSRLRFLVASMQ